MTPVEVARTVKLRLASELADDRASLGELARSIGSLLTAAADARDEWMRPLALAFQVERWYTAAGATLCRALRALDGDVPAGTTWHQEVLRASAAALDGGRPALLTREALREMQELLKFRHLARHGYEIAPEAERMIEHGRRVQRANEALAASLAALDGWLSADHEDHGTE
jgi:hypothetical protein